MSEDSSIHVTFGAMFDGFTASLVLYGAACCQAIQYYSYFPTDNRYIKYLVSFIWLMDTLQQVFVTYTLWHYLVTASYAQDVEATGRANWSLIAEIIPGEICAAAVERSVHNHKFAMSPHLCSIYSFFITRICSLDGKKRGLLLLIPMTLSLVTSTAFVIKCYRLPTFVNATRLQWLPAVFAGLRASTDLGIAFAMSRILYSHHHSGQTQRSNTVIKMLVNYTLATGLFTSVTAMLSMTMYLAMPLNMVYIGVYFINSKVYANALFAALNGRKSLRAIATQGGSQGYVSLFQDTDMPLTQLRTAKAALPQST